MLKINEEYLQSVVYLYKTPEDAESGSKSGGTGFIVKYNLKIKNLKMYFVITNAHVIREMDGVGAVRFNTRDGETSVSIVWKSQWMCHPSGDDVAIISLNGSDSVLENLLHSSIDVCNRSNS